MKLNHLNGFSLIELVVVVAVLAILSAIALPSFIGFQEKAAVEVAKQSLLNAFKECLFNPLSQIGGRVLWEH